MVVTLLRIVRLMCKNQKLKTMKKIISMIVAAVIINMCAAFETAAQDNVGGILMEAKTNLVTRKAELLSGRADFQTRINEIQSPSNTNQLDNGRISALEAGIRDIDSTLRKIDIAIEAIDNSGLINDFSNRVELNRNGNSVKIYKRVAGSSVTVEVNGERILNGDGSGSVAGSHFDGVFTNKHREFTGHLSGLFLGINGLLNKDGKYEAPADAQYFSLNESRSLDFSIYFNDFVVPFSKNFGLVTGFALQINHYSFREHFDLVVVDHVVTADYDHTVSEYFKRFNYRIMHFNMPLVFEFSTVGHRKFFFNAGVMGGIRIGSRTKQIYHVEGDRRKDTKRDPFETNLFKYSFIGGVGYGCVQVFGEYQPVQLFKEGHGPELYPFSLGVKWVF